MLSIRTYARAGLQSQRAPFPGDALRTRISADNHGEAGGLASLDGHGVHGGMQTQHLRSTCKSEKKKQRRVSKYQSYAQYIGIPRTAIAVKLHATIIVEHVATCNK